VAWKKWDEAEFGHFRPDEALYYKTELAQIGIAGVEGLKIGEIGFGNGAFAGWLRANDAYWVGCEANTELTARASTAGYDVLTPGSNFPSHCGAASLDLFVAFDVIEHLELDAIKKLFAEVKEVLKPGGLLMFRVPSGDSPLSGAIFNGDVTHRTLLGSNAVRQLAYESNFEIVQLREPCLPIWGLGVYRAARRSAVVLMQRAVFTFARVVLMGNPRAVMSPDMVVVLRNKERHT
jgi:SAM-dependent methyltransferase